MLELDLMAKNIFSIKNAIKISAYVSVKKH